MDNYCELYKQAKKYTILWPCGKIGNPQDSEMSSNFNGNCVVFRKLGGSEATRFTKNLTK